MLVPAVLYKDEIVKEMQKYFYTDDMLYETACLDNWTPNILDNPDERTFQYAIADKYHKLLGVIMYNVDWYTSKAYNFGLFSFDRGNIIVGKDVYTHAIKLVNSYHRVEWRAVGGNPACKSYDRFIAKMSEYTNIFVEKHVLKDGIKDRDGYYHDDLIYGIINRNR